MASLQPPASTLRSRSPSVGVVSLLALLVGLVGLMGLAGLLLEEHAAAQDIRDDALRATDYVPPAFREARERARVDEMLGSQIPLDLQFTDSTGRVVTLDDYFNQGRPVIIQMAYYRCPKLCGEISHGMVRSMTGLVGDLEVGEQFTVLTVSFDSRETPQLAAGNKRAAVEVLGRRTEPANVENGWHFLTGTDLSIQKLTDAMGYRFGWIPEIQQYSHPAVIVLLTPDGRVSRYLYGVNFDHQTLRLSLINASEGTITPSLRDAFILACFDFDPTRGRYTATAFTIMRIAGAVMVLVVASVISFLVVAERKGRLRRWNQIPGADADALDEPAGARED